jgi:hypothetical protein
MFPILILMVRSTTLLVQHSALTPTLPTDDWSEDELYVSHAKNQRHRSKNVIGEVLEEGHRYYGLMYDMLLGIRTEVGRTSAQPPREVSRRDFAEVEQIRFPRHGSSITPPHDSENFKFKSYSPFAFRQLRERFGIDNGDYWVSLTSEFDLSSLITPGKSGSWFFFTADGRFVIKTINKTECKFLRSILPQYYDHVMQNPSTLVTRFFGLHRVKRHKQKKIRFVVMGNIFPTDLEVHCRYDLKGSTVGRQASEAEKNGDPKALIYKDLDLMQQGPLRIGSEKKAQLTRQLQLDAKFLRENKIMDYSLLVGVHDLSKGGRTAFLKAHELAVETSFAGPPPHSPSHLDLSSPLATGLPMPASRTSTSSRRLSGDSWEDGTIHIDQIEMEEGHHPPSPPTAVGAGEESATPLAICRDSVASASASAAEDGDSPTSRIEAVELEGGGVSPAAKKLHRRSRSLHPTVVTSPLRARAPTVIVSGSHRSSSAGEESSPVLRAAGPRLSTDGEGDDEKEKDAAPVSYPAPAPPLRNLSVIPFDVVSPEAERKEAQVSLFMQDMGGIRSGQLIYYFGIIDILQPYNMKKRFEHNFKKFKYNSNTISAVDPVKYANRFCDFCEKNVE